MQRTDMDDDYRSILSRDTIFIPEDAIDDTRTLVGEPDIPRNEHSSLNATFVSEASSDPSVMVLILDPDNPSNARYLTNDDYPLYTSSTHLEKGTRSGPSADVTILQDRYEGVLATLRKPTNQEETISFEDKPPIKRRTWLSPGSYLSKTIGLFNHNGHTLKWIARNDKGNVNLELHSNDESLTNPVARFLDSRRDWSAPPDILVIHKARMEVSLRVADMLDTIVLSLIVAERMKRAKHPDALTTADTYMRAKRSGFYLF